MPPTRDNKAVSGRAGSDILNLSAIFIAWKAILLVVIYFSPGYGYDTSTKLSFDQYGSAPLSGFPKVLYNLALRLTRWDGIYFSSMSADGLIYEQQWAFSWSFTRFVALLDHGVFVPADCLHQKLSISFSVVPLPFSLSSIIRCSLIASVINILTHYLTAILFFIFTIQILFLKSIEKRTIAFTAACLHIVSPAGVFLIGPYAESTFALLGMLGSLAHVSAIQNRSIKASREHIMSITAGFFFGLATMVRGNGILYGLIFAWDAANDTLSMLTGTRSTAQILRLGSTIIAGSLVGIGFIIPQFVAYQEYCLGKDIRPWCTKLPPSIFSWVQSHYWDVGFLRYWTASNIPLFILAAPMLFILLNTGYAALHHIRSILIAAHGEETPKMRNDDTYQRERFVFEHIMERHGLIQIILALLALTSFHVQIINRISTAYPVWFLVIAVAIHDQSPQLGCGHTRSHHYFPFRWISGRTLTWTVRGFVIYAFVQAGLYSAFLPPA